MAAVIKTLEDIINRQDRFDANKVVMFTVTDDGSLIIPDTNLFQIYRRYINPYIGTYKVSQKLREYYRNKPRLLSADVYGTPELAWLILMLNDRECPSKFTIKSTIRLIPTTYLTALYDTIVTKSTTKLEQNWNTFLPMIGNKTGRVS